MRLTSADDGDNGGVNECVRVKGRVTSYYQGLDQLNERVKMDVACEFGENLRGVTT